LIFITTLAPLFSGHSFELIQAIVKLKSALLMIKNRDWTPEK